MLIMKTQVYFTLLVIVFFSLHSYSQTSTIKFWAYDTHGNTDTIEFGLLPNSSIGIDSILGEQDLTGTSFDSLEIRSIQRDSQNYSCLSLGAGMNGLVYFPQNRDLKNDYRPYTGINGIMNNSFEIVVHSKTTPFYWGYDASNIGFMNDNVLDLYRDSNCHTIGISVGLLDSTDILNGIEDSLAKFHLFIFESHDINGYIVNQELIELHKNDLQIYPNPFRNFISISSKEVSQIDEINLYNSLGQKILTKTQIGNNETLELNHLPLGLYFIEILNLKEKTSFIQKIVKSK